MQDAHRSAVLAADFGLDEPRMSDTLLYTPRVVAPEPRLFEVTVVFAENGPKQRALVVSATDSNEAFVWAVGAARRLFQLSEVAEVAVLFTSQVAVEEEE